MVNESGGGLVSKIDQQIAELQMLRAFAVKNFPEDADTVEPVTAAKPSRNFGVKKKAAAKPTGDEAVKDAILVFLGEQEEPSKAEEIGEVVHLKGGELTQHLRELAEEKRVKRTGAGRGTKWALAK